MPRKKSLKNVARGILSGNVGGGVDKGTAGDQDLFAGAGGGGVGETAGGKTAPEPTPTPTPKTTPQTSAVGGEQPTVFIPSDKLPEGLKQAAPDSTINLKITGKVQTSDETGATIAIDTVETI